MSVEIHPETIADGFTQSEIMTLEECPTKWYLKYNLRLSVPALEFVFLTGSAWHTFKEERGKSKGTDRSPIKLQICNRGEISNEDDAYAEFIERWLEVLADEYNVYYKDDFEMGHYELEGVEEVADVTVKFNGQKIRLTGRIDEYGRIFGKKTVVDSKTVSSFASASAGWEFRFQFMFYLWLQHQAEPNDKATQFLVDAVRKPSIKVKQGESIPGFLNRLRNDIKQDPQGYFLREKFLLTKGKMEAFETNVLQNKLRKLAMIVDPKTPKDTLEMLVLERHTHNCVNSITGKKCEFFAICEKGATPSEFKHRTHKHPELQ